MSKVFCAAMDCEFNGDDGKCHAKDVGLSDHSIMTLWEGRQRYQKCKTYQKSQAAAEMEQFFAKAVAEQRRNDDATLD
jgi:hypothetical protein